MVTETFTGIDEYLPDRFRYQLGTHRLVYHHLVRKDLEHCLYLKQVRAPIAKENSQKANVASNQV